VGESEEVLHRPESIRVKGGQNGLLDIVGTFSNVDFGGLLTPNRTHRLANVAHDCVGLYCIVTMVASICTATDDLLSHCLTDQNRRA
jgi:hypothetical protein